METALMFTILESVESPNNYAMAAIHAGKARPGMAWFAIEQTAGKGQRGKAWRSNPGENIILSIALQPAPHLLFNKFLMTASVAVVCVKFLKSLAGENFNLKWPNDIYWNDRKAGGILIENILRAEEWKWSVAGIGINVNQVAFDNDLVNPVSIKMITGETYDPVSIARDLHQDLLNFLEAKKTSEEIMNEYNSYLYKRDQLVTLKKENMSFKTKVKGVNDFGQLLTSDAMDRCFDFGEVVWLL